MVDEVPCKAVNIMLLLFLFLTSLFIAFSKQILINGLSISSSIISINSGLELKFTSLNFNFSISDIKKLSMGGTICPPSFQYTLNPLYSGGLCEAVKTIPHKHFNFLTAYESSGVGLKDEKR